MDFLTWFDALVYPKSTFRSLSEREKASLGNAVKNVGVAGLIAGVIFGLLFGLFGGLLLLGIVGGALGGITFLIIVLIASTIIFPILSLIGLFVNSIVYIIFAKLLGGKGDFTLQTYFLSLYAAPIIIIGTLLNFIPVVGGILALLPLIYALYPLTIALREAHEFSTLRAILTWGIPYLVLLVIFGLLVGSVVLWQLGMFSSPMNSSGPGAVNTARGFGRIKVMEPTMRYSGSTLEFTIINGAGTTIENLELAADGHNCRIQSGYPRSLGAGATTEITAICDRLSPGDSFSVDLTIKYEMIVAGQRIRHEESGTLRGGAE